MLNIGWTENDITYTIPRLYPQDNSFCTIHVRSAAPQNLVNGERCPHQDRYRRNLLVSPDDICRQVTVVGRQGTFLSNRLEWIDFPLLPKTHPPLPDCHSCTSATPLPTNHPVPPATRAEKRKPIMLRRRRPGRGRRESECLPRPARRAGHDSRWNHFLLTLH